ncbi:MAG: hypothetical protein WDO72_07950 [Pseudomonadota bacterium]
MPGKSYGLHEASALPGDDASITLDTEFRARIGTADVAEREHRVSLCHERSFFVRGIAPRTRPDANMRKKLQAGD